MLCEGERGRIWAVTWEGLGTLGADLGESRSLRWTGRVQDVQISTVRGRHRGAGGGRRVKEVRASEKVKLILLAPVGYGC